MLGQENRLDAFYVTESLGFRSLSLFLETWYLFKPILCYLNALSDILCRSSLTDLGGLPSHNVFAEGRVHSANRSLEWGISKAGLGLVFRSHRVAVSTWHDFSTCDCCANAGVHGSCSACVASNPARSLRE